MTFWGDLDARARGLQSRLPRGARLAALSGAPDVSALGAALAPWGADPDDRSPDALELSLRRFAAAQLAVFARWCGGRTRRLTVVFEDEDRRSLRAVVRGALAGVAEAARLAGLIPTPSLPARALAELARQPTPHTAAAMLVTWGNPYGSALREAAAAHRPDPMALELAVNRAFARRALTGADRAVRAYVRRLLDVDNARTALLLAGHRAEVEPATLFVPGGNLLDAATFTAAARAPSLGDAAARVAGPFGSTPFAAALRRAPEDPPGLDGALLRASIAERDVLGRQDPLGPSRAIAYALRLRALVTDVRRLAWGRALGAPPALLARALVSP